MEIKDMTMTNDTMPTAGKSFPKLTQLTPKPVRTERKLRLKLRPPPTRTTRRRLKDIFL